MEAIVAVYSDWGIGCDGTQPVVIPEDRRHFRDITRGDAVIVGRKTLSDFPGGKPLKNRVNIVLTRADIAIGGAVVVHSVQEALEEAQKYSRTLVIGGASVYKELFPHISKVYVTKIDCIPHSDAFFPALDDLPGWKVTDPGEGKNHDGLKYRFMVYERI